MADDTTLNTIKSELDQIREKERSYAKQRAEGLIDADMHRDLVNELLDRKTELLTQQNGDAPVENEPVKAVAETNEAEKPAEVPAPVEENEAEEIVAEAETVVEEKAEETVAEAETVAEEITSEAETVVEENAEETVVEEEPELDSLHGRALDTIEEMSTTDMVVTSTALVKEPEYLQRISEADDIVVDIRDITKTYKMGTFDLQVLKGVTLQVRRGEFISIMGPSGSGKSTLMNILGALDQATSGEYYLDGVDVSQMNEEQLAHIRNQKIGFVFQSFNLLKRTSALRQVELPLIYGNNKERSKRAKKALEAVGLGNRLDHTPAELSGGQQQRVAIARALVTEPAIILADEPTGNLDSRSGSEVMQIFQTMNREQNITTIFVTHDPWIARHTDRVIMLRDGNIIADQTVKNPLIAGEAERPSEAEELSEIFENTYYGGDAEEYN